MLATRALLASMHSEAEIASVLAHEMGHIEQGHCVDAVKFALLADKAGARPIGEIVDLALRLLTAHSFSKTQEDAADQYAYAMLEDSPYDPHGVGNAFASLLRFQGERRPGQADPRGADPLRDYFSSHPPLEIREATFRERAAAWWRRNPDEKRTLGADNLLERVSVYRIQDAGTSAAR
jgi:Zn-dependent protease with chaperone function